MTATIGMMIRRIHGKMKMIHPLLLSLLLLLLSQDNPFKFKLNPQLKK